MEFMQFHPTVLYIAGSSRNLITEAMRGAGGRLIDRAGHRFMPDYDPRAELAPRDVVSRSIVSQMEKTRHPNVYLDMSHLDPQMVRTRFPGMTAICAEFGLDITHDPIPVRPGAHYMIGGVTVDLDGRTTVPGLWAAGEVTSSGLHGANRLASNSLLEGLVFGKRAGLGASAAAAQVPDTFEVLPLENPQNRRRQRTARFGRYPQFAQIADVACLRRAARCGPAAGCTGGYRPVVQLRAATAIHRPQGLGTAKHAHDFATDDSFGTGAKRNAAAYTCAPIFRTSTTITGSGILHFYAMLGKSQ